jgi:hypothetical protein
MLRSPLRPDHHPAPARRQAERIAPASGTAEREAGGSARRALNGGTRTCACGGGCPRCTPTTNDGDGAGRPMEPTTRRFFEPRLGSDLGEVRIHDDGRAARSAQALGAEAYTVGSDIVFGQGRYAPDRADGRELLAHELAHVVLHGTQTHAGMIFRKKDKAAETEAEVERLYDEMTKLARKNAWSGVDRAYRQIEEMGPDPFSVARDPGNMHFLASEAARMLGDTKRQRELLELAQAALTGAEDAESEAARARFESSVGAIEEAYGTVDIMPRGGKNAKKQAKKAIKPILVRPEMPFAPDQRNSIAYATRVLDEKGEFSGMLPAGDYVLGGVSITVVAGGNHTFEWGS